MMNRTQEGKVPKVLGQVKLGGDSWPPARDTPMVGPARGSECHAASLPSGPTATDLHKGLAHGSNSLPPSLCCLQSIQAAEAERQMRRRRLGRGQKPVDERDMLAVEPLGLAHEGRVFAELELYARLCLGPVHSQPDTVPTNISQGAGHQGLVWSPQKSLCR